MTEVLAWSAEPEALVGSAAGPQLESGSRLPLVIMSTVILDSLENIRHVCYERELLLQCRYGLQRQAWIGPSRLRGCGDQAVLREGQRYMTRWL